MILELLGYIAIFMAVNYGRKEDSRYNFLSKQWFIIILLVVIGSLLVQSGNNKSHEQKQRIHIEKEYNPAPSFQQTYLVD